jgi:hypothetical protein
VFDRPRVGVPIGEVEIDSDVVSLRECEEADQALRLLVGGGVTVTDGVGVRVCDTDTFRLDELDVSGDNVGDRLQLSLSLPELLFRKWVAEDDVENDGDALQLVDELNVKPIIGYWQGKMEDPLAYPPRLRRMQEHTQTPSIMVTKFALGA